MLVPRIRGGRARLRRASAGEALLALAPSTTFQMPFDDGQVVSSLAAVARHVPAFGLDVGDDPDELAQALERVLDAVAGGGEPVLRAGPPRASPRERAARGGRAQAAGVGDRPGLSGRGLPG